MYDPLVLFPMLLGGAVFGFAEAIFRRRGLLQTLINIVVGEAFGLAAALAFNFVPPGPLAQIALYFAPIVGGAVGVMVVLKTLRGERWSTIGELIKTAGGFVAVFVLLFALLWVGSLTTESSKYLHLYLDYPATLAGRHMAGAGKVTVAVAVTPKSSPPPNPRLMTASAAEIFAESETIVRYRLRIINESYENLTIAPGEGVSLVGQMTIAPNSWRDFIVRKMPQMTISIEAAGTGQCSEDVDASRCAL